MKVRLLKTVLPATLALGFCFMATESQASFIQLGATNYLQNFDTLANHGKSSTLPNGWSLLGVRDAGNFYIAENGSDSDGGLKSYGINGSRNRAFGINTAANGDSGIFGAAFQNEGSGSINRLNIGYTGEEWRLGVAGQQNTLEFQYSLNARSLNSGTWINVPSLSFSTPNVNGVGQHNGTLAVNQVPVFGSISFLNIPVGATFWIRWQEVGPGGNGVPGDGLAVDNFSLSSVPEASTIAGAVIATMLCAMALLRKRSATSSTKQSLAVTYNR